MRSVSVFVLASVLAAFATSTYVVAESPEPEESTAGEVTLTGNPDAEPGTGPDLTLQAISPEKIALNVGLAGSDPADIARYLMANGATAPKISPNADVVAYYSRITGEAQIWTVPSTGGASKQITFGNGVTFFEWLPDGSGMIYGADNNGNEQESYYLISADGSEERELLPAVSGGFRSFGDISADGKTITFASTERNGLDFDIYTADLETGETKRLYEGKFGFFAHSFSPDGKYIIVTETVGEDSDNLYLLNVETGALETVSKPEVRANHADGGFAWKEDSSAFYFMSNLDREFASLHQYELDSKRLKLETTSIYDSGDLLLCGEDSHYLAHTENADGFEQLVVRDMSTGKSVTPPELPEGMYSITCTADSTKMSIGVNGWRTPGDVYVWDIDSESTTKVVASNYAGLDPDRFIRPKSVRMTARDGVEVQGLLYLPDESSRLDDGPPPVVFQVHGGPTGQSVASFDAVNQYRVDRGLAVFEPNVRGSTGFGRTYVTLDDQLKRRDSVRDLIDMGAALRESGEVDMDRAAVAGGSYGGYMVNAVLALYPGTFKAGVSLFGVADWVTALEVASPALKASDRIEYGDIREQKWIDYYTENSPIRLADKIDVPVLFSHGVMDPRIDIYETEVMVRTLRANGIETPYIRIPDEGHGWRKLTNRLFYFEKEADFLEQVLVEDGE